MAGVDFSFVPKGEQPQPEEVEKTPRPSISNIVWIVIRYFLSAQPIILKIVRRATSTRRVDHADNCVGNGFRGFSVRLSKEISYVHL